MACWDTSAGIETCDLREAWRAATAAINHWSHEESAAVDDSALGNGRLERRDAGLCEEGLQRRMLDLTR